LSATVAGEWTNVRPVAPNFPIEIGIVSISHATQGEIFAKIGPSDVAGAMVIQSLSVNDTLDVAGKLTVSDDIVLNSTDTDTFIRWNSADDVGIYTGGIEAINIDSAQDVTIPNGGLTVYTNAGIGGPRLDARASFNAYFSHSALTSIQNYGLLQTSLGSTWLNAAVSKEITFRISNVEQWKVDLNGNFLGSSGNDLTLTAGVLSLGQYAKASLPTASSYQGGMIHVTDEIGGPTNAQNELEKIIRQCNSKLN
jgi:hypothetical protein